MRESRGQPLIDSHSTLTYLNLTPPATERCQRFLTRQDFLYTQITQVVSERMGKFWLELVFYMASWEVPPMPSLVSAQAESRVLPHLPFFFLCNLHLITFIDLLLICSFNYSIIQQIFIEPLLECQTLCRD